MSTNTKKGKSKESVVEKPSKKTVPVKKVKGLKVSYTFRFDAEQVEKWKLCKDKENRPSLTNWIENTCNNQAVKILK